MSIWAQLADTAAELAAGARRVLDHHNNDTPQRQVAFTVGVIALGAKMAKADGVVTMDEVNALKEVFKVPEGEMGNVSCIFNAAKKDALGYQACATQLASLLKGNRKLLEDVLDSLFHIAKADGVFHPNEEKVSC
jgi:DnaJ like chaperone protein